MNSDVSSIHATNAKTLVLENELEHLSKTVYELNRNVSETMPAISKLNSELERISERLVEDESRRVSAEYAVTKLAQDLGDISKIQERHVEKITEHSVSIEVHEEKIYFIEEILKDQKKLGKLVKSMIIAALAIGAGLFGYDEMRDRNAAIERELKEHETEQQNQRLKDKRNHSRLLKKEGIVDDVI